MSTKKILILDAEEAPYSLTVARSLGSAGYDVHLGFSYGSYGFAAFSKYYKGAIFYPDPLYAAADFISFFEKLAGKYDFIIPTMEKSQLPLSMIKDELEQKGTIVPIPPYNILRDATNKVKMIETCAKIGINIPKTLILKDPIDIEDIVKKVGVPFIMKTSTEIGIPPGPQNRYFVFKKKPTQELFLSAFKKLRDYGLVILQEWVTGVGIGASFFFSRHHKIIAYFGHRRILERYPDGGPSVIAESFLYPDAIISGAKLLKTLNWQGVAMVEFKLGHDSKLYFMELNPRFWGTLPLAIASGVDFPRLLVEHYDSVEEDNLRPPIQRRKIFVKGLTFIYLLIESIKTRNLNFSWKILKSSTKIFKYGLPFIEELEKLDIVPGTKRIIRSLRGIILRSKPSKFNGILFGPSLPYKKLVKWNIKAVIDLREEHEKSTVIIPSTIDYYSFPIKDDSSLDPDSFNKLVSLIEKLLKKGNIYIHCRLGRGRAPMVVVTYLISKGLPLEKAYLTVYSIRPYTYLNTVQKRGIYYFYKNYTQEKLYLRCGRENEEYRER